MESNMSNFNYIGVHTARYNNVLKLDEKNLIIPINSQL